MEKEEIIENNKLIARFDSRIKLKKCKVSSWYPDGYEYIGLIKGEIGNVRGCNHLKYHESWEWLMPVFAQLSSIDYIIGFSILSQNITRTEVTSSIFKKIPHISICNHDICPIKSIYTLLIKFLKEYNESKKTS